MKADFRPKLNLEVGEVNARLDTDALAYIAECEQRYAEGLDAAAHEIAHSGARTVMLAGPSSSGKTTTSLLLAKRLEQAGHTARVVSLDNFFKNHADYPELANGEKDMESIEALDIEELQRCTNELDETGRTIIPEFSFVTQTRKKRVIPIEVGDGFAIFEGIHALNPRLADKNHVKIYAGLRAEYVAEDEPLLQSRDVRILRRIIRDFQFRARNVEQTLSGWEHLKQSENVWIRAFKDDANIVIDTSLGYEPAVLASAAVRLFSDGIHGGEFATVFSELVDKLNFFVPADEAYVPADSILREFIGPLAL